MRRKEPWVLLLLAALAFALAVRRIGAPGLQYDELLFVNAARGGQSSDLFVEARFLGVPVLLMKYLGALKAWAYHPILRWLPFGAATVRVPAILIGLTGAALLVAALGRLLGRNAVLLGAPIILLDPTVLMQSRLDWGPNALMFLFRGLMLFSLASWAAGRRVTWLWCALGAALLGAYDKLNFVWFIAAALASFAAAFHRELAAEARRAPRAYALVGSLAALLVAAALARAASVEVWLPTGSGTDIGGHARQVARLLALTVCGDGARDFVCGTGLEGCGPVAAAWMLLACLAIAAAVLGGRAVLGSPVSLFFMGTLGGTAACMFLTPASSGVHHAAMIAGLPQSILVALLCARGAGRFDFLSGTWGIFARGSAALLALLFVMSSWRTVGLFERPANPSWDPANQQACAFAAKSGSDCIVADWGLSTLLAGYCRDPGSVLDAWQVLGAMGGPEFYVGSLDTGKRFEVIGHDRSHEYFPGSRTRLLAAMRAAGWRVESTAAFKSRAGDDLVYVYAVTH